MCEPVQAVNSLADLKSLQTSSNPISVFVKYRSQAGDNGGGIFVWNPTSSDTADDVLTVIPNTNPGQGRWKRKFDGVIYPCWCGDRVNGDDHDALQTAMDRPEPVCFDRSYSTSAPVNIGGTGKTVDFNGYSIGGISDTAQDAVLWITGSNLTLRDVDVSCNFKPYNTGIHWMSTSPSNPSRNNRVYGLTVYYAAVGVLFGSYLYVPNPPSAQQSENYIYGINFRGVNNCIQMNQPGGALAINGGNIDCGMFEWPAFDAAASRCYNVKSGDLKITNCELLKTQTQQGYAFEGPATIFNCHTEAQSNWFLNPGCTTVSGMSGYMGNDSASYFTVSDGATGRCVVSDCDFIRGTGVAAYSGQPLINAPNAPDYDFAISNSTFSEWKQSYLTNGNARIHITQSRFPQDSGAQIECERRFASGTLMKSGFGTPEWVVSAPVGSIYLRADGGNGTCLYVKQSGSGSTGWISSTMWAAAIQDMTIDGIKGLPDTTLVTSTGHVSAIFGDCFYIEKADRSAGIRVQKPGYTPTLGQEILVKGNMSTLASFERFIDASDITPIDN